MTSDTLVLLYDSIRTAEGLSLMPYSDSVGVLSIGYGRAIGRIGISHDEAEMLLEHDVAKAIRDLDFCMGWWRALTEPRQAVLVELCFQLGLEGLLGFHKMRDALKAGDNDKAADELLNSKYARQVPGRAQRLAKALRGE